MSERTRQKAVKLVQDGRVAVTYISPHRVVVSGLVRGASGTVYRVTVDPAGAWCECLWAQHHRGALCSHSLALQLQQLVDADPEMAASVSGGG